MMKIIENKQRDHFFLFYQYEEDNAGEAGYFTYLFDN